ncbi:hypothetical protein E4T38_02370 [Aureobasidium subglaciale]|nr:hypothetical protein E4T38_02370 [Aureobasidium subglaciale]KAI5228475.1 hypothetical protein E4T40_02149 [Aureobasidium subglaciale]KAI5232020.1 hypothetical protein E4T41_02369 [Aureobasidium subglaciale]KAI5265833.1 hypothetical protein E4T46_02147 [Aureobasidium subglaciale]
MTVYVRGEFEGMHESQAHWSLPLPVMSSCRRAQSFSKAESLQREPSKRLPCFESAASVTYISHGRRTVSEKTASKSISHVKDTHDEDLRKIMLSILSEM